MRFSKNLIVCSSAGPKILGFSSYCLTNFQQILDCFIPNFKLKYEDSENIKGGPCKYSYFQLTSNQTLSVFLGTLGTFLVAQLFGQTIYKNFRSNFSHSKSCFDDCEESN